MGRLPTRLPAAPLLQEELLCILSRLKSVTSGLAYTAYGGTCEVVRILGGAVTLHSHPFLWVTLSPNHEAEVSIALFRLFLNFMNWNHIEGTFSHLAFFVDVSLRFVNVGMHTCGLFLIARETFGSLPVYFGPNVALLLEFPSLIYWNLVCSLGSHFSVLFFFFPPIYLIERKWGTGGADAEGERILEQTPC